MSNQPKYTIGDWQVERGESGGYVEFFVRRDGDDRAIASDILDPETGLPSEENAHLIAAAKNLLEALIAQERADWALRNFEAVSSDPLHPDIAALKLEMLKTRSNASILRKAAIAKADARPIERAGEMAEEIERLRQEKAELLEALKELAAIGSLELPQKRDAALKKSSAAIAKAEGRGE